MAERSPGRLGERLREAREHRGLSLQQIAHATKISMTVLQALESNDLSRLPGGISSRAFIRTFAAEVGLDPEEAIREFIGQSPQDAAGRRFGAEPIEDHQAVESERRVAAVVLRLALISAPMAALLVYFGAAGLRSPSRSSDARPSPVSAVESDRPVATAARPETRLPAVSEPATEPAPEAPSIGEVVYFGVLSANLAAVAPCWVSATVDGKTVVRREMQAGEQQALEIHRDLVLTIGDASALALSLNGTRTRTLGRPGQVVTLRVNRSNFKEYLPTS